MNSTQHINNQNKSIWGARNIYLIIVTNAMSSIGTGIGMIATPWLIVKEGGGDKILGILAIITSIILFLIIPIIGTLIDRITRKKMMLSIRVFFIFAIVLELGVNHYFNVPLIYILAVYYFLSSLFYAINIPTRNAFFKELFSDYDFHKVNSIMEVENQIVSIIIGVLAVLLISNIDFNYFLILNIVCYFVAVYSLHLVKYKVAIGSTDQSISVSIIMSELLESSMHMLKRPVYSIIMISSVIPYVCVILFSYLYPVFLSDYLNKSGESFAIVEMIFAGGAASAGVLLPYLVKNTAYARAVLGFMVLFATGIILQAILPNYLATMILAALLGFGNSAVRIVRFSLMMDLTDHRFIGRVGAVLQSITMAIRAICFSLLTIIVTNVGVIAGLYFVAFLITASTIIFYFTLPYLPNEEKGAINNQY